MLDMGHCLNIAVQNKLSLPAVSQIRTLDLNQVALDAGDNTSRPRFRFPHGCPASLLAPILSNMTLSRCPNRSRMLAKRYFPSVQ